MRTTTANTEARMLRQRDGNRMPGDQLSERRRQRKWRRGSRKTARLLAALALALLMVPLSGMTAAGSEGYTDVEGIIYDGTLYQQGLPPTGQPPVETESDAAAGDGTEAGAEAAGADLLNRPISDRELIVGCTSPMQGDFFTDLFGNAAADIDVRALIHGYNLVHWDEKQGTYLLDTSVIQDSLVMSNDAGDRTYYLILQDDLYYSDGTPITAWDYAFSILLELSPEMREAGGRPGRSEHLLGAAEYLNGQSETLSGVRILSDRQIAVTLDHRFLPYFHEQGLLMIEPYPIREIAPGCRVYDDDRGAYIGNEDREAGGERIFTAELLKKTVMDPETGYRSHPKTVSGPYRLTEFDGTTARFEINPYFKGTMDGVKPAIRYITYTYAENSRAADMLKKGEIHLLNKMSWRKGVQACEAAADESVKYPRSGLTLCSFSGEKPTVAEREVRQAIAWCMDRDAIAREYCGEEGTRVDGLFGMGQWEYLLVSGQISYPDNMKNEGDLHSPGDYEATEEAWSTLTLANLTAYQVNTIRANALLDKAGWTMNPQGGAYDSARGETRAKEINGEIVPLELKMLVSAGSPIAGLMEKYLGGNLKRCGIRLTVEETEPRELLRQYYRETERTADMIFLGSNGDILSDPSIQFGIGGGQGDPDRNRTAVIDEDLYFRAVSLRNTDPYDVYDYVARWVAFQERYSEALPAIPVYSNYYYDFWCRDLKGYDLSGHKTWSQAVLAATFEGDHTGEAMTN